MVRAIEHMLLLIDLLFAPVRMLRFRLTAKTTS